MHTKLWAEIARDSTLAFEHLRVGTGITTNIVTLCIWWQMVDIRAS